MSAFLHSETHGESFAEALTYFPTPQSFVFGPEEYLEHLGRVKAAVKIPVIASLNGTTPGGWLDYPPLIESTGADALELNLYRLAFDRSLRGQEVERESVEVVREVRRAVRLPLAVKLSPFYSSFANFATQIDDAGANGLVLFNRFYQPDISPEDLELNRTLSLSDSRELPLRLRWLGVLSGQVRASLAVSGGVHDARDAIKAVMAGAHAVQVVSALLRHGPEYLKVLRQGMDGLDAGVRVGVPRVHARQHEPRPLPRPHGLRARELHDDAAGLAEPLGGLGQLSLQGVGHSGGFGCRSSRIRRSLIASRRWLAS